VGAHKNKMTDYFYGNVLALVEEGLHYPNNLTHVIHRRKWSLVGWPQ